MNNMRYFPDKKIEETLFERFNKLSTEVKVGIATGLATLACIGALVIGSVKPSSPSSSPQPPSTQKPVVVEQVEATSVLTYTPTYTPTETLIPTTAPTLATTPAEVTRSYYDNFNSYKLNQAPNGWIPYGSDQITTKIIETNEGDYRLRFSGGFETDKHLIRNGPDYYSITVTYLLRLESNNDEAGIVIAFKDISNHIRVRVNPYWDEMRIVEIVNGQVRSETGTGRGGLPINTDRDYWMRVIAERNEVNVYWSVSGNDFSHVLTLDNVSNIIGKFGFSTGGYLPPVVSFDDLEIIGN